jgi:formylglycine-generating enzyme required for sulfatase activity
MTLKGLQHPHIVEVYELIQEGDLWGMVMEFVDGQELAEYIEEKGALSEAEALRYIRQVGEALVYLHEKKMLHRDIKPHNIMLRESDKKALLIDFGLARGFIDGRTMSMTNSHTPAYAPIEQYDRHGKFGPYTDIYALAATLYHLITSEAPLFNAKGRKEAQEKGQSIDGFLWDKIPETISQGTKEAIVKGMAVLPEARSASMVEFLSLLGVRETKQSPPPPKPAVKVASPPPEPKVVPPPEPKVVPPPTPPRVERVRQVEPVQPAARVPSPARNPAPEAPKTRRNFLKWVGFGGGGAILALVLSQLGKNSLPVADLPVAQSLSEAGKPPKLSPIQFASVTLDGSGKEVSKPQGKAEIFTESLGNDVNLTMVKIPAGKFLMGSPASEKGRNDNESPQHEVKVPEFYMAQTLVTQAQWQAIMGNNPSAFKPWFQRNDTLPVEEVSWQDAMDFCGKLSQKTGRKYILPSEAQWEYACRSGTTTPFAFGETITPAVVNYNGNVTYGNGPKGEWRYKTTPVGSFPPNLFGLYDMHGNVREWCQDKWHGNYNGAPIDGSAWLDGGSSNYVWRGGSWLSGPNDCRSAFRFKYLPGSRYDNMGFRVVVVVVSDPRTP